MNRRKLKRWLRFFGKWFWEKPLEMFWGIVFWGPVFVFGYIRRKGLEKQKLSKMMVEIGSFKGKVTYGVTREEDGEIACVVVGLGGRHFIYSDPDIVVEVDQLMRSSPVTILWDERYAA